MVLEQTGQRSVGYALAAVLNLLRDARGITEPVSPEMLYLLAKRYDEFPPDPPGETQGTSGAAALRGLRLHGVSTEATWKRLGLKSLETIPPELATDAARNRPAEIHAVPLTIAALQTAIFRDRALLMTGVISSAWAEPVEVQTTKGDRLTVVDANPDAQQQGGHAFAIVGYNEVGFLVQNSWGRTWGRNGYATWPYEKALASAYQAWSIRLLPSRAHLAGYASDGLLGEDRLGITPDVRAIASLITARAVKPPLALGLFGDWGSGKSFFMERLQEEVGRRAAGAKEAGISSPFCSSVIQIKFNAWHYLDTNLWASLVAEVFEELFQAVSGEPTEAEVRQTIERELGDAKGLFRESQLELTAARNRRDAADADLEATKKQAAASTQLDARAILERARQTIATDPDVRKRLNDLAVQSGIPADRELGKDLRQPLEEVRSLRYRAGRLLSWMARQIGSGPGAIRRVVLLGAWVVLPTLLLIVANSALDLATPLAPTIGAIGGLLFGLRPYLAKAKDFLGYLEQVSSEIDAAQERERAALTATQQQAFEAAVTAQTEAEKRATDADARVHELESSLAEFAPARQVQKFLKDKATSQTYASQLGLVSLIRRDFERLTELLRQREDRLDRERGAELERLAQAAKSPDGQVSRPRRAKAAEQAEPEVPIDRIVLYIDDLDRCKPRRVVEVLEAVHLLLAFRLFVVIVAVDPRWLRRCLEDQYPELLSMAGHDGRGATAQGLTRTSTPQDYLEKIFQIPFYLRPLRDQGFVDLVGDLVGKDVADDEPDTRLSDPSPATNEGSSSGQRDSQATGSASSSATSGGTEGATGSLHDGADTQADGEPERLMFNSWEVEDMQRLSPLFRTPRSAKRFVNTYRLVRATVDAANQKAFEGTRHAPGSYRHVLLLLSVVAGYPNVAPRLLLRLAASATQPSLTWSDFVKECSSSVAKPESDIEGSDQSEWRDLCEGLEEVSKTDLAPKRVADLNIWIPQVARYSFSVSLPGAINDLLESVASAPPPTSPRRRPRAS